MAKRRTVKRLATNICETLLAECVAAYSYGKPESADSKRALIFSILRLRQDFIAQISHVEPGMEPREYFRQVIEKFNKRVAETVDQIYV